MKIKITDIHNELLSNVEIHIEIGKEKKKYLTDSHGLIELSEVEKGTKIVCYIIPTEKQKFVFDDENEVSLSFSAPKIRMIYRTVDGQDRIVIGANVSFEYEGKKVEKSSDNDGLIELDNIPVNTEIRSYQLIRGEQHNINVFRCIGGNLQFPIKVETQTQMIRMKIKLVERSGQAIKNADVRIKSANKEYDRTSGQDGYIIIDEVEIGDTIECKQLLGSKILPWHKFKCETEIDEYILHGERPTIYGNYSDKIESQVRMKFRLVNSKGIPIPNAVLRLEYGDKVRNKYTNQYGESMVEDVLIGDKIKAFVDIRGNKVESELICQEDNELHEIILKSSKLSLYVWLVPLFAIIVFLIFYTNSSISSDGEGQEEKNTTEHKKDTVIISEYSFFVKNSKTGKPVADASVKLLYRDTIIQKHTNEVGLAKFRAFTHIFPQKYELNKLGYNSLVEDFKPDSVFYLKLTVDDSTEIYPVLSPCGSEVQSKGAKTTIKSFKMNMAKGRFHIWYDLFNLPAKVDIYKGHYKKMDTENLIYSNKGFLKGISHPYIEFESPDSIITVRIEGIKGNTAWVYKLYCARLPVKINPAPVVQEPTE
jgi:hypothetical protein